METIIIQCNWFNVLNFLTLFAGVAVIDYSLLLFGKVFVFLAAKHKQQILEHLAGCVKEAKSQRQQALLINVFTALLSALKNLNEAKSEPLTEPIVGAFVSLIQVGIASENLMLRCAAGEALGRLAQVVGEPKFVAETVQNSFDLMQTSRDLKIRTGHCMILGCLHRSVSSYTEYWIVNWVFIDEITVDWSLCRSIGVLIGLLNDWSIDRLIGWLITGTGNLFLLYWDVQLFLRRYVGGMATNQHLKNNIMILKALAEDVNAPTVQVWALHALYLIADSGGPMFRGYVEQTLSLCLKLLLTVPRHNHDVFHCIGKCLSALITAVGPELNGTNEAINTVRNNCLTACVMMHSSNGDDWISQSEAVQSFQQVMMGN